MKQFLAMMCVLALAVGCGGGITEPDDYDDRSDWFIGTLQGHTGWVYSVSYSPDGSRIASGSGDDTVRIWSAATGAHLRTLDGHMSDVRSVSYSPDGSRIVSGSDDGTIRVWDAAVR